MHIKSIGAALALALLPAGAFAADLPARRAPVIVPPLIPVFSWAGLYIGAHGGYQFGSDQAYAFADATGTGLASRAGKMNGFVGGGHVGYNFGTHPFPLGSVGTIGILGIEADVDGSASRGGYALGGLAVSTREGVQGSIRGRLGLAYDRALFYLTGGAAFGGLKVAYLNTLTGVADRFNHGRFGPTVGAGVEYAFSDNWIGRVEYRYTDFGNYTDNLANSTGGGVDVTHHVIDSRVLGGISYKFDTVAPPVPVVARY